MGLQEKVKSLRLSLSELQDTYYPEIDASIADFSGEEEEKIRGQIEIMERLKLENQALKKENGTLQKTIIRNENQGQNFVHNLHDGIAKLVRGDFSMMNENNLLSPSKQFTTTSSSESIPELVAMSEPSSSSAIVGDVLLDNTDGEDEDDED